MATKSRKKKTPAAEPADASWEQRAAKIGSCTYHSLAEMVAALNLDWDRYEELKDERSGWEPETDDEGNPCLDENGAPANWESANPDEAEELKDLTEKAGDCEDREDAERRISEDPLSIEIRSDWYSPGTDSPEPGEFRILLGTGGPATRIIGELDQYYQPTTATLQVQDWWKPWTDYEDADEDVLLDYCRQFYFGEG